jgi:glycosyltransferase involved in cell wall biosynthesis
MPLQIAAKVDPTDRPYFESEILPLLQDPLIEFVGEIGEVDKGAFLGDAAALLFPIDWPEPFGLVQVEAMATGTPVIAFRGGSVPEIIEDGVTGFIVDDIASAVAAIPRAKELDRRVIRQEFERRFTDERMARDYLAIYRALLQHGSGAIELGTAAARGVAQAAD